MGNKFFAPSLHEPVLPSFWTLVLNNPVRRRRFLVLHFCFNPLPPQSLITYTDHIFSKEVVPYDMTTFILSGFNDKVFKNLKSINKTFIQ